MKEKTIVGIIAIIIGLLILIFPFAGTFTIGFLVGVAFIMLGAFFIVAGGSVWGIAPYTEDVSVWSGIAFIIIGILAIIVGFILVFNLFLFDLLVGIYLYLFGILIIIMGIVRLFQDGFNKGSAVLSIILGIITIILGYFALLGPEFVAIIIGIALIVDGFCIAIGE